MLPASGTATHLVHGDSSSGLEKAMGHSSCWALNQRGTFSSWQLSPLDK
jgi:hypothetical protein